MCIVFYTLNQPGYKLILASNRDEYLDRPTLPAQWHTFAPLSNHPNPLPPSNDPLESDEQSPWVLSGRDNGSPAGGTWLGLTRDLRLAVLTNIRIPPVPPPVNAPSRGVLLKGFLSPHVREGRVAVQDYLKRYQPQVDQYEGFNLLLFQFHPKHIQAESASQASTDPTDPTNLTSANADTKGLQWGTTEVGYLSNRPNPTLIDIHHTADEDNESSEKVGHCCGLSNTPLNKPWPKVRKGETNMTETLRQWTEKKEGEDELVERLMEILQQTKPLDSIADLSECTCLHPIPVGKNPEKKIEGGEESRWYGTRVTTVILIKENAEVTFVERDIFVQNDRDEAVRGDKERKYRFQAEMDS